MQISRVCTHAIIKERYIFPKKRDVFWCLASGVRRLASGYRRLASDVWLPASGYRHLATGVWRPGGGGHGIAHRSPEMR